jgi:hypothetical protein
VEAAYLGLFEAVGKRLCVLSRDLKVTFSGFPLTCRRRGHTGDRLREAGDPPERPSGDFTIRLIQTAP